MDYQKQLRIYAERRERIQRAFNEGMPVSRIVQIWKITRQRVYQILGHK